MTDAKANLRLVNSEGRTALYEAVRSNNIPVIEHLLSCGANINARDNQKISLLHDVALQPPKRNTREKENFLNMAELLLKNKAIDVNIKSFGGEPPFHTAAIRSKVELIKLFLKYTDVNLKGINDNTALNLVAQTGNFKMIEVLVELGADVNNANTLGKTPLHSVCLHNYKKDVKFLL